MPGINGLQLYHRTKAIDQNIKILFVTALDAVQELISVLPGIKSKDVIIRPVNRDKFVQIVETSIPQ